MKIIKRDGRIVDYDRSKIAIAIEKANREVKETEKANSKEIKKIIEYIEDLDKKRMLVEDIQDTIEQKLMEMGKFELAKKYIVYRYTRALVRKQNTTDETILGLIRNENKEIEEENSNANTIVASTQRDYIAGEVSRDLTKRLLLPEKIVKADQEGVLHFHNSNYFVQPIFNCCSINLEDMLDNGTVINGKTIESPKSFQVACIVTTQIINNVASNQYGELSINVRHLSKYLRKSYDKIRTQMQENYKEKLQEEMIEEIVKDRVKSELKSGIQTLNYQINTSITANGHSPKVTLFLYVEENDQYVKETSMIVEEILKQSCEGMKNELGEFEISKFPKIVYVLDENNCLNNGEYDYLTKLAEECSLRKVCIHYISAKKMRQNYDGNVCSPMGYSSILSPWKDEKKNYKFVGRFNQGVVTINLPQIAIVADKDEEEFWKLLDERLELCKEALLCRHYALMGTKSDISPIHWQYGAISRLEKGEKIDNLLEGGYSTISLGYIGIYEMTILMKDVTQEDNEGNDFAIKVLKYMKEMTEKWRKETNIAFDLYGITSRKVASKFARIDKEKFGTIKHITDKGYYTSSFYNNIKESKDNLSKILSASEFQKYSSGGAIYNIEVKNISELENVIKLMYDNIQDAEINSATE